VNSARPAPITPAEPLAVSSCYPGLELATTGLHWLAGLPLVGAQILVLHLHVPLQECSVERMAATRSALRVRPGSARPGDHRWSDTGCRRVGRQAAPGDFTVVNNTSFAMSELYVGPSASDDWGSNFLDGQVINPSQTASVSLYNFDASNCLYDVAVVGTEGQKGVMYKFDLCNLNTLTFSDN
jgi:hypothetical protein